MNMVTNAVFCGERLDLLDSQENVIPGGAHRTIAEVLMDRCGKVSRDGVGGSIGH